MPPFESPRFEHHRIGLLVYWDPALIGVVERVEAGAPALVGKGGIGDHVIERLRLEGVAVLEFGVGQRVALHDERRGVVVEDHGHLKGRDGEGGGGERDAR
jgi:hypothetical protein